MTHITPDKSSGWRAVLVGEKVQNFDFLDFFQIFPYFYQRLWSKMRENMYKMYRKNPHFRAHFGSISSGYRAGQGKTVHPNNYNILGRRRSFFLIIINEFGGILSEKSRKKSRKIRNFSFSTRTLKSCATSQSCSPLPNLLGKEER